MCRLPSLPLTFPADSPPATHISREIGYQLYTCTQNTSYLAMRLPGIRVSCKVKYKHNASKMASIVDASGRRVSPCIARDEYSNCRCTLCSLWFPTELVGHCKTNTNGYRGSIPGSTNRLHKLTKVQDWEACDIRFMVWGLGKYIIRSYTSICIILVSRTERNMHYVNLTLISISISYCGMYTLC